MAPITLPILHFNDVYNMASTTDTVVMREGQPTRTKFDRVVQFSEKITDIRRTWVTENEPKGLVLFSGDLFSPSVESILTTGRNMVHLMNELAPDACVPGNHEFDYGRERFNQLTEFCNFDWILSNVKEYPRNKTTKQVDFSGPGRLLLREYSVVKRSGLTIGIIGVMSEDAMNGTLAAAKANLRADAIVETCKRLSSYLRKPKDQEGQGCDIVIALTHAEHTEDVVLAKALNAYPDAKKAELENLEGVDAIFGGHNHNYALGQGVELTNASNTPPTVTRGDDMDGDDGLLIVKSGYDFEDLSQITLELEPRNGTHRKYVVTSLKVRRHRMVDISITQENIKKSPMERVLRRHFQNEVMRSLDTPVVKLPNPLAFDSKDVRKGETAIGNWVTDTVLAAYIDLRMGEGSLVPTMCIITAGSIRCNGLPKICRRRDIVGILPFPSTPVVLKLTGQAIKNALKGALSHRAIIGSGQFPIFSGIKVQWKSTEVPERRVQQVLVRSSGGDGWEAIGDDDEYCVLTNDYLAEGNIGFGSFKHPRGRFDSDLPVFQVLLSYLETAHALDQLFSEDTFKEVAVFDMVDHDYDLDLDKHDAEVAKRFQEFEKRLNELGEFNTTGGKKQFLDDVRDIIKRGASFLYGQPERFIPRLNIKGVDGRMVDVSQASD